MQQRHRHIAEAFNSQPERVVEAARDRTYHTERDVPPKMAQSAWPFSKERNLGRARVVEERDLLRDALRRSMGDAVLTEVQSEFEKRIGSGEFIGIEKK